MLPLTYYAEDGIATDMSENEWLTRVRGAYKQGEHLVDLHAVEAWIGEQKIRWEVQGYTVALFSKTQGTGKNSVHVNIRGPSHTAQPSFRSMEGRRNVRRRSTVTSRPIALLGTELTTDAGEDCLRMPCAMSTCGHGESSGLSTAVRWDKCGSCDRIGEKEDKDCVYVR